jgi:hypothetical protein
MNTYSDTLAKVPRIDCHYSEANNVTVEDRGAGFGKVYIHLDDDDPRRTEGVAGVLLWSLKGVQLTTTVPTQDQISRAVRALAETPRGRIALGMGANDRAPEVWP